ncbi:MAG: helix-turn-helix domain-containing protein [Actinomycetota bacterium]|nr:helix-turn-helix domain-containing protein [Actinomycetota bacterium]
MGDSWPAIPASYGRARPHESGIIVIVQSKTATLVAVVVYDGVTLFELGVATEIFGTDHSQTLGVPWYRFAVCGAAKTVTADGGLRLQAPHGLRHLARADTVIVPPCESPAPIAKDVLAALGRAHRRGARLISLCTGALVLAQAGLLDERRATTHWSDCERLAQHRSVTVDPSVLYIDDGDILTSAGSAASIDLCLHVVRTDYGADIANRVARLLVVPPHRDGGQAQYIDAPMSTPDTLDLFGDTIAWMRRHLDDQITIDQLAQRAAMSPRTFARRFHATTGTTPYRWLLRQRVQHAQTLLETTDLPVEQIAQHSGLSDATNLRKHFNRVLRVSPQTYRRAFRSRTDNTAAS